MKQIRDSEEILTTEDFTETQALIDEYKEIDESITNYDDEALKNEKEMKSVLKELRKENKNEIQVLEKRINVIEERELEQKEEDEEFNIDIDELKAEFEKKKKDDINMVQEKIKELKDALKEKVKSIKEEYKQKNEKIEEEKEKKEEDKKFFRTDTHIKIITMEIEAMKAEIKKQELLLSKKNIELKEFYQQEETTDTLKWQEIYREQSIIENNIKELNSKIEEYTNFKEELLSISLTPEEYKKMFEKEAEKISKKQEESEYENQEQETPENAQEKSQEPEVAEYSDEQNEETEILEEQPIEQTGYEIPTDVLYQNSYVSRNSQSDVVSKKTTTGSIKITLGNDGKIIYKDNEYPISTEAIRIGLEYNEQFKNGEINEKMLHDNFETQMRYFNLIDNSTPIDFTVLLAIKSLDIRRKEQVDLIEGYLKNAIKAQYQMKKSKGLEISEEEQKIMENSEFTKMDIIYDMNNLSKHPSFFKALFSKNLSKEYLSGVEKQQLLETGNNASRYGLGKTIDQYKKPKGLFSRFLKKRRELLPEPKTMKSIDMTDGSTIYQSTQTEEEVARMYNKHYGKDPKSFRKSLYTERNNLVDEGKEEQAKMLMDLLKDSDNNKEER